MLTESRESGRLTSRETQILRLVARGLTNSAIAHQLGISARTVEEHLARAFAKLGASNRTDAVVKAFGRSDETESSTADSAHGGQPR
jgi:DNA-binding NarL/FixJ family response regulator